MSEKINEIKKKVLKFTPVIPEILDNGNNFLVTFESILDSDTEVKVKRVLSSFGIVRPLSSHNDGFLAYCIMPWR